MRGKYRNKAANRVAKREQEARLREREEQEDRRRRLRDAGEARVSAIEALADTVPMLSTRREKEESLHILRQEIRSARKGNKRRMSSWRAVRRELVSLINDPKNAGGRIYKPLMTAMGNAMGEGVHAGYGAAGRDERFLRNKDEKNVDE